MEEIKLRILWRLYRHRYIGGKHTAIENLKKGFPKDRLRLVEEAVEELIKEGLIVKKPTGYGLHVSINPHKIGEVRKMLKGWI